MNEERLVDAILDRAVELGASDIHLTNNLYPTFRIDGVLTQDDTFPKSTPELLERYTKEVLVEEHRWEQHIKELSMDSSLSHGEMRYRVHTFRQSGLDACVLRLIPTNIPDFKDIGMPEVVRSFATVRNGLVLVTGVTGSGKSTTLAALIGEINATQKKHIVTVEDPIEFKHDHKLSVINQREVGEDVHSFSDAVSAAMREDPDILLVGEMRDLETISNAITMAESGHLVFGTLHTKSASESVDRIVDVFPPEQQEQIRMQLANSIEGIVSQDLLPRVGGGRVPSVEVMVANDAIRNLIRNPAGPNAINDQIQQNNSTLGSQTRIQSLAKLLIDGLISRETAIEGLTEADVKELLKQVKTLSTRGG